MMGRLYDDYKHPEPWDHNLPADLIPPIKHLRKIFDENHFSYGWVTQKLCYHQLHPNEPDEEIREYVDPLQQLKVIAGTKATQRFIELIKTQTAPAIFKSFFDLYLDGITVTALAIFHQLAAVGKANEQWLGIPHLQWAEAQTKNLIRSNMHRIEIWIRNVCDKQIYDPKEDFEDHIHWRKWQAPMLLVMKPSRYMPYDRAREWERNDRETSVRWIEAFAEHYVLNLEVKIEHAAGMAALELAKQPPPPTPPAPAQEVSKPPMQSPSPEAQPNKPSSTRRDAQKKATQAKYKSWQKEYEGLRKSSPDKSDVWYSLKISRMPIAKGSSSETIRRHMKRK
jgi:hypothetical protein